MALAEPKLSPWYLRWLALGLVSFALAFVLLLPELLAYPKTPDGDGRFVFHQIEMGKAALRYYHELPLWNAFDCRGIPNWDHPESMTASPILLLLTPFNGQITYFLWELVHTAMGFASMWVFARSDLKLSRAAAFAASGVWTFNESHTMQYIGAHSTFLTFYLAPLLVHLWRRAEEESWAGVALGALLAFMLYEGATYPLPFCLCLLALDALVRVWPPRRLKKILRASVVTSFFALTLGGARILPLLDQMAAHRRAMPPEADHVARWNSLYHMYTLRQPLWYQRLPGQEYTWHEYNAYVGYLVLFVAAVGITVAIREQTMLVVVACLLFVLMLGHFFAYAPWSILRAYVPPFKGLRVPTRFRIPLAMYIASFVGLAIDRFPRTYGRILPRNWQGALRVVLLGMALVGVGDMLGVGAEIVGLRYVNPPTEKVVTSRNFHFGGPGLGEFLDQPRQNRAWLGCRSYEWPSHTGAPVWEGDVPQGKIVSGDAQIVRVSRTHNTFTAEVHAISPGRIAFNTAHDRGWVTSVGKVVEDQELVAVEFPTGDHVIRARYWPRTLTVGMAMTVVGVLAALGFAIQGWRRRRAAREGG